MVMDYTVHYQMSDKLFKACVLLIVTQIIWYTLVLKLLIIQTQCALQAYTK